MKNSTFLEVIGYENFPLAIFVYLKVMLNNS